MSAPLETIDQRLVRNQLTNEFSWQAIVGQSALRPYVEATIAEIVKRAQPPGLPITIDRTECQRFSIDHGLAPTMVTLQGKIGIWPLRVGFDLNSSGTLRNSPLLDGSLELIGLEVAATGNGKFGKIIDQVDMNQLARDASLELEPSLHVVIERAIELPTTHRLLPPHIQLGHREATITLMAVRID